MFRLFKSKIFSGAMYLILAGVLSFLLLPRLYKSQASTAEIVRLKQTVEYGTTITDDMLTTTEVGAYGLPDEIVKDTTELVGLVAGTTIYAGEYLWRARFMTTDDYSNATSKANLGLLDGTCLLTINLPTASSGIAGILRAGDIVDVYGATEDGGVVTVNEALIGIKVFEVLNSKLLPLADLDAKQKANPNDNSTDYDFVPAYVVFSVNEQQAKTLIGLEKDKSLHLTLREAGAQT